MINLSYDLHIHSCLSPCGDDDMTPANIAGMAALKGLDVIAVTDHNSCKNCPAVLHFAEEYGILALPGMEICTSEEVHAVCLFSSLSRAMEFDEYVYERLIPFPNKEEIFGKQQIYNKEDVVCGTVPNLLINSVDISFDGLWDLVRSYGGVMFPAHLDKSANSLISNLGFVPPDSQFTIAEVKDLSKLHELKKRNPYLEECRIISNSDAHYLEDIHEPRLTIEAMEKTREAVVQALLHP
ncbi:PHP domain-containing protein [Lacrimispora saccharolytica]|uniref:PHP domain protein n=1 Tax=Lacrimispora saccharolytica (strain ATCC 35040 / DSM 2544 / NRCC 2533 / WM1) TaxID=610130 RepID=D9R9G1_LACSW|nr:PHP domain-containing protein [Lacrimispora saccharolytica]ADL05912.1 PHP domain protein [[Clostridium] saccharolyticum WM1]QRV19952.1 PHP domain-containing protein [Lacrimispora saccharolytica]